MPLNRPALPLGPGPRGVQDARRWVVDTCTDIGRTDLLECAELGVSELVTNALLHAVSPIQVRVRGTREHPRVEVRDGSREAPEMPDPLPGDEEELLLTFGRGLGIVARCSDAWGVEIEGDGKIVWFNPARAPRDDLAPGVVTGLVVDEPLPLREDDVLVDLVGVPLRTYQNFQRHYRELRREVRLLALAHESDYPLAKELSDIFADLEQELHEGLGAPQVEEALVAGAVATDLHLRVPAETASHVRRFIELLDLADAFCRQERLLSLARSPEQQRFQRWFLEEFVRQDAGKPPRAWGEVAEERRTSVS